MRKIFALLIVTSSLLVACGEKEEPPFKPVDPELEKAVKEGKSYMPEEAKKASQSGPGNNMSRTK